MRDIIPFPVIEKVTLISPSASALATQEWEIISLLARVSIATAVVASIAIRVNAKMSDIIFFNIYFLFI